MNSILRQQRGLTLISWLVILMMVGFFILLGLRLAPVYMQNYTVKNIITDLQQESGISRKPASEIRELLLRRFDVNGIENLGRENIKISRARGKTKIEVAYETRKHIAGNVDVVVTFNESFDQIAN